MQTDGGNDNDKSWCDWMWKIAITRHLPEYASNPDAEIAGVYDFNLERAKEVAEQYQTRHMNQ